MREKILGSPMALSLASTQDLPMTIAGLAVGGVVLTVGAGVYAYHKWEQYNEKEHRKEMEAINRLYKRFLERIVVPGYDDIQGFPAIFKFTGDENSAAADFLRFTDDEIRDIGKRLPHGGNIALAPYRQSLVSALLKLKGYYFKREDHNDITSAVLSYLLYIISTKCLNFQGYEYDIAYLEAITQFINAYASMKGEVNSQHFTRLQKVYKFLLSAKKYLERHKDALSIEELVTELNDCCCDNSVPLLRSLVKMTIDKDDAHLSEEAALEELAENKLQDRYVEYHIMGFEIIPDLEINLPDTVFKEWILSLAKYYIKSLKPISSIMENNVVSPEVLFSFIPWAKGLLEETDLTKVDSNELKQLEKSLKIISKTFKSSPNFLNTKLDPDSKKPRFIPVSEQKEILDRTTLIAQFARLIHSLITLQYLCAHLLKSIKQLGDIYVKDPNHFREIFAALNQLLAVIKNGVNANLEAFKTLEDANQNAMRLDTEELFARDVVNTLKTVKQITKNLGAQIMEYRNKTTKTSDPTIESVTYEMHAVANLITKMYPSVEQPLIFSVHTEETQGTSATEPLPQEAINEQLHQLTASIFNKIRLIQQESLPDPKVNQYLSVYRTLNSLQAKTLALLNEIPVRQEKSQKMAELTLLLCHQTLAFLSLNQIDRQSTAASFIQGIHNELNHPKNNAFIDKHSSGFSEFIYTNLSSQSFFRTDTRKKFTQFEEACEGLRV